MKAMKNKMTMLFAAMLFVLVLAPSVQAKAYGIDQTDATSTTATITWDAATSTSYLNWVVYLDGQYVTTLPIGQTSYTFNNLAQGKARVATVGYVYQYYDGSTEAYEEGSCLLRTKPSKVKKSEVIWRASDYVDLMVIDPNNFKQGGKEYRYADGFEIKIKDVKGKTKKTFKELYNFGYADEYFKAPSSCRNKGMQYSVRGYIKLDNGKKIYGDSVTKVVIPQAKITKVRSSGKNYKVTWKKVSGASSYTIYRTSNKGKSYKKVKTVSKNTTSYSVKKSYMKYSKSRKYGIVVVANKVKVGKKRYNSTKSYHTYAH